MSTSIHPRGSQRLRLLVFVALALLLSASRAHATCSYYALTSGTTVTATYPNPIYTFNQANNYWTAVAVRPNQGASDDWDMSVYQSQVGGILCVSGLLGQSQRSNNGVDYVIGDFNFNPTGTYYAVASYFSGSTNAAVQWDDGADQISVNAPLVVRNVSASNVIEVWDTYLTAGTPYTFTFIRSGAADVKLALFANPGSGTYWTYRDDPDPTHKPFEVTSTTTYTPSVTGWFGLVVINDNGGSGTYDLGVGTCTPPVSLTAYSSTATSQGEQFYSFAQPYANWMAVGVGGSATPWFMQVFGSPSGLPYPKCFGNILSTDIGVSSTQVSYVVGDFNYNPVGTYYARAAMYDQLELQGSGTGTVEWDAGGTPLTVDGSYDGRTLDATHILNVWQVYLTAGQTYGLYFDHAGSADIHYALFRGLGGTLWRPRGTGEFEANASHDYTAPSTGWYGVIVVNDNRLSGSYTIGVFTCRMASTVLEDINPDLANGSIIGGTGAGRPGWAGLMIGLAGDTPRLYSVSSDAGVWRSYSEASWTQLATSPRLAYCIAADPSNISRVAVGTRGPDITNPVVSGAGIYESSDGGDSWPTYTDPTSGLGCGFQGIFALVYSRTTGSLFASTSCGMVRKRVGETNFTPISLPGLGIVTALAASQTKVWARTSSELAYSSDDGVSWTRVAFPGTIDGYHVSLFLGGMGADIYSLAAFDHEAAVLFSDSLTSSARLLLYDAGTGLWHERDTQCVDGTGLGGRRFVKSFFTSGSGVVGNGLELICGDGQEVYRATAQSGTGAITWQIFLCGGACGDGVNPPRDAVHSDFWDFALSSDGTRAWVANDGGIFERVKSGGTWGAWTSMSQGLHTHIIFRADIMHTGHASRAKIAYASTDNGAWGWDASSGWIGDILGRGDANWTMADEGNPVAMMLCGHQPITEVGLYGYGQAIPQSNPPVTAEGINLIGVSPVDGVALFQFIQTPTTEDGQYPLLDGIMMVQQPLKYDAQGDVVSGALGQPNPGGYLTLIRNTQFLAHPNLAANSGLYWSAVASDVPATAFCFRVAGGHANPRYFVCTTDGAVKLRNPGGGWQTLITGVAVGSTFENPPFFVNPYNPDDIWVVMSNGVVEVSYNAVSSPTPTFAVDNQLTQFASGQGRYSIGNIVDETRSFQVDPSHWIMIPMRGTLKIPAMFGLSSMGFNRENPNNEAVAGSRFGGVAYWNGAWKDFNWYLPQPLSAVTSVGIDDCDAIYVATAGRGMVRIDGFRNGTPTAVEEPVESQTPLPVRLAVHPNPSTRSVAIEFSGRSTGKARGTIYDVSGRLVRDLGEKALDANTPGWLWDTKDSSGRPVAAGVYLVRAATVGSFQVGRVVVIR